MPVKEEEDLQNLLSGGGDAALSQGLLLRTVKPALPHHCSRESLRQRMKPGSTIVLTCGNPEGMADIRHVAGKHGLAFDMEEW